MRRLFRRETSTEADAASAAATVRTLAVLLQAGAVPRDCWRHLARGDEVAERIARRIDSGGEVAAIAAEGGVWRDVAAAWEVAATVGAPLAEVLRALAQSLQDAAAASDDVRVALAEPAATARLMLWLPVFALLLGFALGFDTLRVIFTTVPGALCVLAGVGLVLAARRWTAALLRRARPDPATPGLHAELLAVALAGGVSMDRARAIVSDAAGTADADRTDAVLALSGHAGVPAGELLRASAAQERHRARIEGRLRAATFSSRLLLPLGVCTLPAFVLLGIAPLLLSVLSQTPLLS